MGSSANFIESTIYSDVFLASSALTFRAFSNVQIYLHVSYF